MFFVFAITTDSVGVIIRRAIVEFRLSMTAGGASHYGSMTAIVLAGLGPGFLADRYGRKRTIVLGLATFMAWTFLYPTAGSLAAILALLVARPAPRSAASRPARWPRSATSPDARLSTRGP